MGALIEVVLPVFLVMGFGYVAVWRGAFSLAGVDGLMKFTQNFAIPALLFKAMSTLDFSQEFDPAILLTFYLGAFSGFLAGLLGARLLFKRNWVDSVAIGFCGLFSNSILLGLPISERAFGADSLHYNYTIIAIHAPFCFGVGVTAMEIARSNGGPWRRIPGRVVRAMFSNALVIGLSLGLIVNFTGIVVPALLDDAIGLMVRAALPTALFGLGGILVQYRPEGDLRTIAWVCLASLVVHPTVAYGVGMALGLETGALRAAVLTGAMAPGVNTYIFANLYGAAKRVAASGVLLGTAASVVTVWIWLLILP